MSPLRHLLAALALLALVARAAGPAAAPAPAAASAYSQALALYKKHQYPDARVAFAALVVRDPQNAKARYFLGMIAMKRNDYADAIEQFTRATEIDPTNSDYFGELGGAYGAATDKASLFDQMSYAKKCCAALEKSVALNPGNLDARRGLVDYYRQAPSFLGGGIIKAYDQAQEIRRRDLLTGTLILGQLYVDDHRYDEAIDLFNEMLARKPDCYMAHYSIGRIAAETGRDLAGGEQHLRRCLTLPPDEDEPSHAAVLWRIGNLAELRHDAAAARLAYQQALQLEPHFRRAETALAKLP
ncbi:MAG: tetratricopeptide repeat protein [Opitutales bacterium]